jgi:LacI family transcriptional regulator
MRETTLEIANSLGISITTVSKALKNYPDVSDKTKKSCHCFGRRLNYTQTVLQ